MRYLLDVNALVAFGHTDHLFHARVVKWAATVAGHDIPEFATCPITELGFVRVMSQVYGVSIVEAKALLGAVKEYDGLDFEFVADDHGASRLPSWCSERSKQPMAIFLGWRVQTVVCLRRSTRRFQVLL